MVGLAASVSLWSLNICLKGWDVGLEELHAPTPAHDLYPRLELEY